MYHYFFEKNKIIIIRMLMLALILIIFFSAFLSHRNYSLNVHPVVFLKSENISFLTDEKCLKIDCRSNAAFAFSKINNSVNLTLEDIKNNHEKVASIINRDRPNKVVIYCYGSNCDSSDAVARYLVYTGMNIQVYKEGWKVLQNFTTPRSDEKK